MLAFYKYRFIPQVSVYVSWFNYLTTNIIIPLGISFLTFEIIHYAVDTRRGKIRNHDFVSFVAFIMFFPSFAAGPIKRFQSFSSQPKKSRFSAGNMFLGSFRILLGLFKKLVIADSFSTLRVPLTSAGIFLENDPLSLWVAVFAFSLEIYFDFSGYSDIAIGSAKMFGITIPENFSNPYMKTSIRSFWRSWHISLYKWVVDYIFIPLGGSRRSKLVTVRNILIVFAIIGFWHGSSPNFILWGIYHGLLLLAYHLYGSSLKGRMEGKRFYSSPAFKILSIAATFVLVSIGWLFFVITDTAAMFSAIKTMALMGGL